MGSDVYKVTYQSRRSAGVCMGFALRFVLLLASKCGKVEKYKTKKHSIGEMQDKKQEDGKEKAHKEKQAELPIAKRCIRYTGALRVGVRPMPIQWATSRSEARRFPGRSASGGKRGRNPRGLVFASIARGRGVGRRLFRVGVSIAIGAATAVAAGTRAAAAAAGGALALFGCSLVGHALCRDLVEGVELRLHD